jgi:AcrR family transcriptional regulator
LELIPLPYPPQVDRENLVETARRLIEAEGSAENVSLAMLAASLGVKAPSLYRHVDNKAELLQAVNLITHQKLTASVLAAAEAAPRDPRSRVLAMGRAYREFVLHNSVTYQLAYAGTADNDPDPSVLEALAIPLQQVMAELAGEAAALTALRGIWALMHGFTILEIQGRFRRGGDIEGAFLRSLEAYVDGWECG